MIASRSEIHPADVASHYDDLDQFYREVWGEHVHHGLWLRGDETRARAVEQLAELVAHEAQAGPGRRICDIGCGYGETARLLAALGADVTAVTISPAQFAVAQDRQTGTANPNFVQGDWLENDFAPDSFDAAIAIESSEHMPDLALFFQQAHRVLRAEGTLVVCAWLAAENPGRGAKRWLLEPICREGRMPQMGSATEYQALAEKIGFRLAAFDDLTRKVERTWWAIVGRLLIKFATNPRYLWFILNPHAKNRIFALTIFRICVAYRIGAMRYGIFKFVKA
ncbi:MAG: methyltransferase domain-containing protein [Chthoniobacterales bacterium]